MFAYLWSRSLHCFCTTLSSTGLVLRTFSFIECQRVLSKGSPAIPTKDPNLLDVLGSTVLQFFFDFIRSKVKSSVHANDYTLFHLSHLWCDLVLKERFYIFFSTSSDLFSLSIFRVLNVYSKG